MDLGCNESDILHIFCTFLVNCTCKDIHAIFFFWRKIRAKRAITEKPSVCVYMFLSITFSAKGH